MNPFSWLSKAPEKAVDIVGDVAKGIMGGIDMVWETDEEKKIYDAKMVELKLKATTEVMALWVKTQEVTVNESSIRSITRRMIAIAFVAVYLVLVVAGAIVHSFDKVHAKFLFETAGSLNYPMVAIIVFYFGYYAYEKVKTAKKA